MDINCLPRYPMGDFFDGFAGTTEVVPSHFAALTDKQILSPIHEQAECQRNISGEA